MRGQVAAPGGGLQRLGAIRGALRSSVRADPSIKGCLHRVKRPDTEWVEKALQEDVDRGQLKKGSSLLRSPAFVTNASPDHEAIKLVRRLVVDCRALHA